MVFTQNFMIYSLVSPPIILHFSANMADSATFLPFGQGKEADFKILLLHVSHAPVCILACIKGVAYSQVLKVSPPMETRRLQDDISIGFGGTTTGSSIIQSVFLLVSREAHSHSLQFSHFPDFKIDKALAFVNRGTTMLSTSR